MLTKNNVKLAKWYSSCRLFICVRMYQSYDDYNAISPKNNTVYLITLHYVIKL